MAKTKTTTTKRPRRRPPTGVITPHVRAKPLDKYRAFLSGLAAHKGEKGFPEFFAETDFASRMQAYVTDVMNLDQLTEKKKQATSVAAAARAKGDTVLGQSEAALIAKYGPDNALLADFGIPPKGKRPRRAHKAAHAAGAGATTGGGTAPSGGGTASTTAGAMTAATGGAAGAEKPTTSTATVPATATGGTSAVAPVTPAAAPASPSA